MNIERAEKRKSRIKLIILFAICVSIISIVVIRSMNQKSEEEVMLQSTLIEDSGTIENENTVLIEDSIMIESENTYSEAIEEQSVTEIILDKTELTIEEGNTVTIIATITSEDTSNTEVEWVSSNEDIATVSTDGRVKGIKIGKTTITATATDGSEVKATCEINVIDKASVEASTLNKGAYIKYNVEYTDTMQSGVQYSNINGWRLYDYKVRDDGKTLYDVKLISTGVPARMQYLAAGTTNNARYWVTSSTMLNTFKTDVLGTRI